MNWVGLLYPLVMCCALGSMWSMWHITMIRWRLSVRREQALVRVMDAFVERDKSIVRGEGYDEEYQIEIARAMVALSDELHMQTARAHFWTRVPQVGKSWPNYEPAPLLENADRAA